MKKKVKVEREDLLTLVEISAFYTNWNDKSKDRRDYNKVGDFCNKYKIYPQEALSF